MLFWIGLIIGVVLGVAIKTVISRQKPVGSICVYDNEDDDKKPYMFLVLDRGADEVFSRGYVMLKIEKRHTPTQK